MDDDPERQRKYDYYFLEATRLKSQKEYAAAFELYKHCLEIQPDAPSALYEIAQYYLFLNQKELGEAALEGAVKGDPDNYWYNQALAGYYQREGKTEEAIELYKQMMVRFPGKQDPLFALIDIYGDASNYEKLIEMLDLLEDKAGKNEQITMEKFRIYLQIKDDKKAFAEIEGLVKEYPLDMRYLTILGDVYLQNDKKEQAYETYRKVLSVEPTNPQALYSLANYYEQTGQKELYEQQINTLLLNKGVDTNLKMNLMRQLVIRNNQAGGDSIRVIQMFDKIIEQDADDTQIPMLYVQYLLSKQMQEETVPVLEHILRLDPTNTAARLTLLGQAINKNDFDWVIRICEPGIEASPESIEFYYYLGIAYYQAERLDDALNVYQKALLQVTNETNKELVSDFYNMIGDIRHSKKEMKEAFAAYDSALIYNANNIPVLNNYAYYLSIERRDLDRAAEMSYKTVKAEPTNSTYLDTYAWILFEKKNYSEARIYIDQALQNDGEGSDVIIEHAGDIYYMAGDVEGALKHWQKAEEMGSESKTLKKKIKRKKYIAE
nr:tetratricopeptide repeat protein [Bacteroides sp. 224]